MLSERVYFGQRNFQTSRDQAHLPRNSEWHNNLVTKLDSLDILACFDNDTGKLMPHHISRLRRL